MLNKYFFYSISGKEENITFALRGLSGKEKIKIFNVDGKKKLMFSTQLTKDWEHFSFPTDAVRIRFIFDNGDVVLRDPSRYEIQFLNERGWWHCSSKNPDKRCIGIQEGRFSWSGDYIVKAKYKGKFLDLLKDGIIVLFLQTYLFQKSTI